MTLVSVLYVPVGSPYSKIQRQVDLELFVYAYLPFVRVLSRAHGFSKVCKLNDEKPRVPVSLSAIRRLMEGLSPMIISGFVYVSIHNFGTGLGLINECRSHMWRRVRCTQPSIIAFATTIQIDQYSKITGSFVGVTEVLELSEWL